MADTIKNSYSEANAFTSVIFQKGRDVMDFELNEAQRNIIGRAARAAHIADSYIGAEGLEYLYAADGAFEVLPNPGTTTSVLISGYGPDAIFALAGGMALTPGGVDLEVPLPGTPLDGVLMTESVFLDISEDEVADPNEVLTNNSKRSKLVWSAVVYAAGIDPPAMDPLPIWAGGHHYYKLAEVDRLFNAGTEVTTVTIRDFRRALPQRALRQLLESDGLDLVSVVTSDVHTPTESGRESVEMQLNVATHQATPTAGRLKVTSGANRTRIILDVEQTSDATEEVRVYGATIKDLNAALKFADVNATTPVALSDAIDLSGKSVSKWGKGAVTTPILRSLNNSAGIVVGTGTSSLGGLNCSYLSDVWGEALLDGVVLEGLLTLLDGKYLTDELDPFSYHFPTNNTDLTFNTDGHGAITRELAIHGCGSVVVQVSGSSFDISATGYAGRVVVKGITFQGTAAGVITVSGCQCLFEDCKFVNVQVQTVNPKTVTGDTSGCTEIGGQVAAVEFRKCSFAQPAGFGTSLVISHEVSGNYSDMVYLLDACHAKYEVGVGAAVPEPFILLHNSKNGAGACTFGRLVVENCRIRLANSASSSFGVYTDNYGVLGVSVAPVVVGKSTTVEGVNLKGCHITGGGQIINLVQSGTTSDHQFVVKELVVEKNKWVVSSADNSIAFESDFIPVHIGGVVGASPVVSKVYIEGLDLDAGGSYFSCSESHMLVATNAGSLGVVTIRCADIVVDGLSIVGCGYQGIPDLTMFDFVTLDCRGVDVRMGSISSDSAPRLELGWPSERIVIQPALGAGGTPLSRVIDGLKWVGTGDAVYDPDDASCIRALPVGDLTFRGVRVTGQAMEAEGISCLKVRDFLFYASTATSVEVLGAGLCIENSYFAWSQSWGHTLAAGVYSPISSVFHLRDAVLQNVGCEGLKHGVYLGAVYGATRVTNCTLTGQDTHTALYMYLPVRFSSVQIRGGNITCDKGGTGASTAAAIVIQTVQPTPPMAFGMNVSIYGVDTSWGETFEVSTGVWVPRARNIFVQGIPSTTEFVGGRALNIQGCETGGITDGTDVWRTHANGALMLHNVAKLDGVPVA